MASGYYVIAIVGKFLWSFGNNVPKRDWVFHVSLSFCDWQRSHAHVAIVRARSGLNSKILRSFYGEKGTSILFYLDNKEIKADQNNWNVIFCLLPMVE